MSVASTPRFRRFVAIGDSLTEGVGDEPNLDGSARGWADRFAELLAQTCPELKYANLAIRGRRSADVRAEQLPRALSLDPDLASVIVGVNDAIRPRFDLVAALDHVDSMQRELRDRGVKVLTATFPDLSEFSPAARLVRGRIARFNAGLRDIAARHGAIVADLATWPLATDPRLWCEDRIHLNAEGHARLAGVMAAALGVSTPTVHADLAPPPPGTTAARLNAELRWARSYFVPWIGRRISGRSSGDRVAAKRPALSTLRPQRGSQSMTVELGLEADPPARSDARRRSRGRPLTPG